ncbi:hypothetical protein [Vreelandella massiliensis]|uniref:hypothetical protein n=1 Tax=Vreelandella massiliensis TaxID=1816686 RepID=UPI00096A2B0C|nr:hypothetical protein [Halomonas massiliensis]
MPIPTNDLLDNDRRRFELIHQASECFDRILAAIDTVCERYEKEQPHAWAMNTVHTNADWLRRVLSDMWHDAGVAGNATSKHTAVIAASPELREAFHTLNELKGEFHEIADEMKGTQPTYNSQSVLKEEIAKQHPQLRAHLNTAGLARLSLKKTWRRLFVFDEPVRHVGIGWYVSGRSIVKISVEDAEKRLIKLGADQPHVAIQLKKLANLPPGEPLALVRKQSPLLRCNIQFAETDENPKPRPVAFNSSMPLIVPPDLHTGLLPPLRTPPAQPHEPRGESQRRKDTKVEDSPFLPSICVHRYYTADSSAA